MSKLKYTKIIIDENFTVSSVNNKLWVFKVKKDQKLNLGYILKNFNRLFSRNTQSDFAPIGASYNYPAAWIYIPISNQTNVLKKMMVDVEHHRCDTLTAFLLYKGKTKLVKLGEIYRNMPFNKRIISLRSFAIPFNISPNDSVTLLLNTKRVIGIHELNVIISTEKSYISKVFDEDFLRFSSFSISCFFVFALFSLGIIFKHGLLTRLGIYTFTMALGQLNFIYFFDQFGFPDFLNLDGNNIGIFIIFLSNCLLHPFATAYIKGLNKLRTWHKFIIGIMVTISIVAMLIIMFFPITPVINSILTNTSLVLSTVSIIWLFYISILGFLSKNGSYLLITVSLIFIPILYKTFIADIPILNYSIFQSFYLIILLGYLTISLFKRELTSRDLTTTKIKRVEHELETVRKTEIHYIGRNLHDQLGNTLASAMGYLDLNKPNILQSKKMILNAINEIRLLSHNLVKNDDRNLDEKLDDMIERFNDFSPIAFAYRNFSEQKLNRLSIIKQESVFMITQEVLNNIIKHSKAKEAVIQVFLQMILFVLVLKMMG